MEHSYSLWLERRRNGRCDKRITEVKNQLDLKNHHEEAAKAVLLELKEIDNVFTFVRRNRALDGAGIDWVVGRHFKVHGHGREFRFHLQQKIRAKDARIFHELNPCIPVWIHRVDTPVLDGKINVLYIAVDMLIRASSPYVDFFQQRLDQFLNNRNILNKFAI